MTVSVFELTASLLEIKTITASFFPTLRLPAMKGRFFFVEAPPLVPRFLMKQRKLPFVDDIGVADRGHVLRWAKARKIDGARREASVGRDAQGT